MFLDTYMSRKALKTLAWTFQPVKSHSDVQLLPCPRPRLSSFTARCPHTASPRGDTRGRWLSLGTYATRQAGQRQAELVLLGISRLQPGGA